MFRKKVVDHKLVIDPQTIRLYAPEQWTERFFDQKVNAQKHVIVLCFREGESY